MFLADTAGDTWHLPMASGAGTLLRWADLRIGLRIKNADFLSLSLRNLLAIQIRTPEMQLLSLLLDSS